MKKFIAWSILVFMFGSVGVALASTLPKVWSTNETLKATDLNNNFSHIHGAMRGGGHIPITNSDIDTNAGIAHTKLATPSLLPKATAYVSDNSAGAGLPCAAGTCTLAINNRVTSVTRSALGIYHVTLAGTPTDAKFMVSVTTHNADETLGIRHCATKDHQTAAPQFKVICQEDNDVTPGDDEADLIFSFQVYDDTAI